MDRAQFLQGLRTGGPRTASYGNTPLSANPTSTRFASGAYSPPYDDSAAQLTERLQSMNIVSGMPLSVGPEVALQARLQQAQQNQQQIMMLQAQAQIAAMLAAQGGGSVAENQAMHLQMEVMRLQALQQQQNFQTQMMLQNHQLAQQQQANQARRLSELQNVPSTAGPLTSSFADANAAAQTRAAVANQLRARAAGREASMLRSSASDEEINVNPPMTAAVNGKFAAKGRAVSSPLNPNAAAFVGRFNPDLSAAIAAASSKVPVANEASTPITPTYGTTTVISGGTPLGGTPTNGSLAPTPSNSYNGLSGYNNTAASGPTKSDSATTWRRGSATPGSTPVAPSPSFGLSKPPSPPLRNGSVSPPSSFVSRPSISTFGIGPVESPTTESMSATSPLQKIRPSPLRFSSPSHGSAGDQVAVARFGSPSGSADGNDFNSLNDGVSSNGSPTSSTPPSSAGSAIVSKEREEASRKLYEGLGIGRPLVSPISSSFNPNAQPFTFNTSIPYVTATAPTPSVANPPVAVGAKVEPVRQPIGPPCSVDELGQLNFASRMRKRAIGGLAGLMEKRNAANFGA